MIARGLARSALAGIMVALGLALVVVVPAGPASAAMGDALVFTKTTDHASMNITATMPTTKVVEIASAFSATYPDTSTYKALFKKCVVEFQGTWSQPVGSETAWSYMNGNDGGSNSFTSGQTSCALGGGSTGQRYISGLALMESATSTFPGNDPNVGWTIREAWTSATPPPIPPIHVPYYACGRTMRDLGGGQWFVDLEAANLTNDAVLSDIAFDSGHKWVTSWGITRPAETASTSESKFTLALPPLSSMPEGGWTATFYVDRNRQNPDARFASADFGGGDFHSLDQDGDQGPAPSLPWWMPTEVHDVFERIPDHWKTAIVGQPIGSGGHHWLAEMGIGVKNDGVQVTTFEGGDFDSVTGTCTVTINPVDHAAGNDSSTTSPTPTGSEVCGSTSTSTTVSSTTTTTVAAAGCVTLKDPAPTSGEPDPGAGGGEDGDKPDCSAGFASRIPIIGGAADLVARLVCSLKQILISLFVPDDLGSLVSVSEYSGKFPASWVAAGVGGVGTLQSSISTGAGGSACGPEIQMPAAMNGMLVRMPGPASCGGNGGPVTGGDNEAFELFGFRGPLRALMTVFLYLGVVWRLLRLTPWLGGKDDGGPTF